MLHILFTLYSRVSRIENFEVDEFIYSVLFGVALNEAVLVLMHPANKIACYSDIQCAAGTTGQDIQIVLPHGLEFPSEIAPTSANEATPFLNGYARR